MGSRVKTGSSISSCGVNYYRKGGAVSKKSKGSKICPAGKAWAERTFDTYPSAYANMYASAVCSGKIKPGGKKKSKKRRKK